MSDMLEKAIIDAAALKEAAVRNAENVILEKYSNQIKEAVGSLLEQEDPMAAEDPAAAPPAGGAPMEEGEGEEESPVMEHIPLAVTSEDLDEEIEIPLENLMNEIKKLSEIERLNGAYIDDPEIQENALLEVMQSDLEEILLQGEQEDHVEGAMYEQEGDSEALYEDDEVILDEEDLGEALEEAVAAALSEELIVDIHPRKSGWAGTPESSIRLAEEELLALEMDSERREHNTAIRKAVDKVTKVNESLTKQNTQFRAALGDSKKQVTKFQRVVLILKEKLDEVNLRNAKLLYQNKALDSASLNERQKRKLVEAVSSAESVEEAKVIFETLEGTVGSTSRKSQPKSLGEAVEKSSSMILSGGRREPKRQTKKNPTYDRWKSLAGLAPTRD